MNKKDYEEILAVYKEQINMLKDTIASIRQDNIRLSDQVFRLQDGLMAVRAPEAYRDFRNDMTPVAEIPEEERKNLQLKSDLTKAYFNSLEQPLFKSASDMEEILAPSIFGDIDKTESVHGNSES